MLFLLQICSYQMNQDQPKNCGCICKMNGTFYSMSTRMSSVMRYYFLTKLCIINIVLLAHIVFLYSELIICRIIYNSLKTLFAASCWQENLTSLEAISSNSAHRNYDTARRVDALHSDLQKFKIMKQVVDIVLIAFLVAELVLAGLCVQVVSLLRVHVVNIENLMSLEAISSNSAHRNYDMERRVDALHSDLQKVLLLQGGEFGLTTTGMGNSLSGIDALDAIKRTKTSQRTVAVSVR
ncbi:uncharacterized protein LOC102713042 isoform X1 [Oryza brachyantha]|uniref:uncharacterized protein LOC102713042 isoform X1 n=1 Tax=Oryza brachyantha TaxID=4533 RepID=UPI001ADA4483|nr:uncharacterized protein LOC102713042 isoform X1 [Oryza brachyantha]